MDFSKFLLNTKLFVSNEIPALRLFQFSDARTGEQSWLTDVTSRRSRRPKS